MPNLQSFQQVGEVKEIWTFAFIGPFIFFVILFFTKHKYKIYINIVTWQDNLHYYSNLWKNMLFCIFFILKKIMSQKSNGPIKGIFLCILSDFFYYKHLKIFFNILVYFIMKCIPVMAKLNFQHATTLNPKLWRRPVLTEK